jgi:hypothetical protein
MDFVLLIKHGIVGYVVSLSVLVNALTVNKFLLRAVDVLLSLLPPTIYWNFFRSRYIHKHMDHNAK